MILMHTPTNKQNQNTERKKKSSNHQLTFLFCLIVVVVAAVVVAVVVRVIVALCSYPGLPLFALVRIDRSPRCPHTLTFSLAFFFVFSLMVSPCFFFPTSLIV